MRFDYSRFIALAERLLTRFGREVKIRRVTGSTPRDPARPELGIERDVTDFPTSETVRGAFLSPDDTDLVANLPGQADERTNVTRETDSFVIIPTIAGISEVVLDDRLVDVEEDGREWEILKVRPIKPGPTLVATILEVAR